MWDVWAKHNLHHVIRGIHGRQSALAAPLAFLHGTRPACVGMQSSCALYVVCVLTEVNRERHLHVFMRQL